MKKILLLSLFLCGCATQPNKIDIIAQQDIKKEYKLPELTQCKNPGKIKDGTLEEYYSFGLEVKKLLKECNQYNEEKKGWIERNFKND